MCATLRWTCAEACCKNAALARSMKGGRVMKANLLRVVKSALARPPRPLSEHPDANLLAAFAENTLLARERAAVAGHLADCAECREFLALAFRTIEAEPAAEVQPRAARRWSPVWNWAASTAAICIVVSAVWEFRAHTWRTGGCAPGPPAIDAPAPAAMPSEPPATASTVAQAQRAVRTPPQSCRRFEHLEAPYCRRHRPLHRRLRQRDALAKVRSRFPRPYTISRSAPEPGARYLIERTGSGRAAPPAAAGSATGSQEGGKRLRRNAGSGARRRCRSRVVSEAPPVRLDHCRPRARNRAAFGRRRRDVANG